MSELDRVKWEYACKWGWVCEHCLMGDVVWRGRRGFVFLMCEECTEVWQEGEGVRSARGGEVREEARERGAEVFVMLDSKREPVLEGEVRPDDDEDWE